MNHIKFTLSILILVLLSVGCRRTDLDLYGGADALPSEVRISFSLLGSDRSNMEVSGLRAITGLPDDKSNDPYINSLWVLVFNADGTQDKAPMQIKADDMLANGSFWIFPHDMNYGDKYHVYFITNPEDGRIDLKTFDTEAKLKDYKWDVSALEYKKIYTMNTLPEVRMLVAGYEIGVEPKANGGHLYGKRISPVGYEDMNARYAELHSTTNLAVFNVELVRTYSQIHVVMSKNDELEKKQKEIFKDAYSQTNDIYTTFSLKGYAKQISLFGTTPQPDDANTFSDLDFRVKLSGDTDGVDAIQWSEPRGKNQIRTAELTFYFPAVNQEPKEVTKSHSFADHDGNPVTTTISYNLPCLDISYKHGGKTMNVYVNAQGGEVFKPNYIYGLPITFYPADQGIWLVRMRNIKKEEPSHTIKELQTTEWVARTFANELEYGTEKQFKLTNVEGDGGKLYSDSRIYYGNIHTYSTLIETLTIGGPAYVANSDDLPKWMKDIKEIDKESFNYQSTLVYRQLWLLNPQEIKGNDELLRGDIRFRNLYDPNNEEHDLVVHASFNVLARVAIQNLGELNKFADGNIVEYDPKTNEPKVTDPSMFGKLYQWGRNLPMEPYTTYRYKKYEKYQRILNRSPLLQAPVDLDDTAPAPTPEESKEISNIWLSDAANDRDGNKVPYILREAKAYVGKYKELSDGKKWTDITLSTNPSESLRYSSGLNWFKISRNEDLEKSDNQWAWIVRKTCDKYGAPASYKGNNDGDPCPGPEDKKYRYYHLATNKDFSYIFYNELNENSSGLDKTVMTQKLDTPEVQEKGLNPGGDPQIEAKEMRAYYKRVHGKVYALRFIGTKFQSFFVYEDANINGRGGLKVSVALTPSGKTEQELKGMVDAGTVESVWSDKEVRSRFFPYSGSFVAATKFRVVDKRKKKGYWMIYSEDCNVTPPTTTTLESKKSPYAILISFKTHEDNQESRYSDYHLNTLKWVAEKERNMYYEFDFDIEAKPITEGASDRSLYLATTTVGGPIRCVRL